MKGSASCAGEVSVAVVCRRAASAQLRSLGISSVGPAAHTLLWLASTLVPVPTPKARVNTGHQSNPASPLEKRVPLSARTPYGSSLPHPTSPQAPNKALQPTVRAV